MRTARLTLKHRSAAAGAKGAPMRSSSLKRFARPPLASLAVVVLLRGTAVAEVPGALGTGPVPKPNLAGFLRDEAAAGALGKALFLGMQLRSDGIQACGRCHLHR